MQTLQIASVCICTTQLVFRNPLFSDMSHQQVSGSCHFEGLSQSKCWQSHTQLCSVLLLKNVFLDYTTVIISKLAKLLSSICEQIFFCMKLSDVTQRSCAIQQYLWPLLIKYHCHPFYLGQYVFCVLFVASIRFQCIKVFCSNCSYHCKTDNSMAQLKEESCMKVPCQTQCFISAVTWKIAG